MKIQLAALVLLMGGSAFAQDAGDERVGDRRKKLIDIKRGLIEDRDVIPTFFEFVPKYIINHGKNETLLNNHFGKIKAFADYRGEFDYEDVNWNLRQELIDFMYETGINSPNTANRIIKTLKQFMTASRRAGYHNNFTYEQRGFGVTAGQVNKLVFYEDEIQDQLLQVKFKKGVHSPKTKQKALDLFIIGYDTALRFSDFSTIKPYHIKKRSGMELIDIITQKTGEFVSIPLSPRLKTVLEKYNFKIPKLSQQKFNDQIKQSHFQSVFIAFFLYG